MINSLYSFYFSISQPILTGNMTRPNSDKIKPQDRIKPAELHSTKRSETEKNRKKKRKYKLKKKQRKQKNNQPKQPTQPAYFSTNTRHWIWKSLISNTFSQSQKKLLFKTHNLSKIIEHNKATINNLQSTLSTINSKNHIGKLTSTANMLLLHALVWLNILTRLLVGFF